jgi:predicted glutamine amidotransferase
MCELMAMSFESPISADFSLQEFAARGEENPDGWGLGWYPDRSLAIVKEPRSWGSSHLAGFLESYPTTLSRTYLAHVRHKTTGGPPTHADTHPFGRELGGRDYCFAHNGTLDGPAWDLPLGHHRPIGDTDSERFFCHLLHEVANRSGHLDGLENWLWLHETLSAANRMGKLNCLLSDGHRLFVYHDLNGWKGLNFRKIRVRDGQPRHFGDETLSVDLRAESTNHGFVVATCPLSTTGWHSFRLGELIVFDRGEIRFSSHRERRSIEFEAVEPVVSYASKDLIS